MADRELATFPDDWTRALVIVAHPDDVEWGSGPAVATWTAGGHDVRYLLASRGEAGIAGMSPAEAGPLREREQLEAARLAGVSEVEFLDHPDGRIEAGLELRRDLARAIRRHQPELVVTLNHGERWGDAPGAGWNTPDHRDLGRSALDAVGDAGNEWIFPELTDEGHAPWDGVRYLAISASASPTHVVDATDHLDVAVQALAAHRTYLEVLRPDVDPDVFAAEVVRGGDEPGRIAFEVIG
jgi:LmbE family N-acetylglucosaminyl deacetylase